MEVMRENGSKARTKFDANERARGVMADGQLAYPLDFYPTRLDSVAMFRPFTIWNCTHQLFQLNGESNISKRQVRLYKNVYSCSSSSDYQVIKFKLLLNGLSFRVRPLFAVVTRVTPFDI